jgi:hypothetical protein
MAASTNHGRTKNSDRLFRDDALPDDSGAKKDSSWISIMKLVSNGKRSLDKEDPKSFGLVVWAALYSDEDFNFRNFKLLNTVQVEIDDNIVTCVSAPDDRGAISLHGMRTPRTKLEWLSQLVFIMCAVLARAGSDLPPVGEFSLVSRAQDACGILRGTLAYGETGKKELRLGDLWQLIFLRSPGPEALFWSNASLFTASYKLRPTTSLDESRVALFVRFQRLIMWNWKLIQEKKINDLHLSVKHMFVSLPKTTESVLEGEQQYKHLEDSTLDDV